MGLETGNFISDLIATNPTGTDPRNQGDDHIRLVKSVLKTTFPNVSGAITLSHTEINSIKQIATETEAGIVEKATRAEAMAGTANKFPDAARVHAAFNQYGLGRKVAKGADFDVDVFDIPDGDYYVSNASVGTKPPGQTSGHLNVSVAGNGLTTVQLWRQATGTRLWARSGGTFSGVWSDWSEIYHSGNLPASAITWTSQQTFSAQINALTVVETIRGNWGTALAATHGSIWWRALSGNITFTDSLSSGQWQSLHLVNGSSYTVTWPGGTKWLGGAPPTLTANDLIVFWKVGSQLYANYVGSFA